MILTDVETRVLQYIHAANTGGYRPLEAEVEEWRLRPQPLPGAKGKLLSPAVPGRAPAWAAGFAAASTAAAQMAEVMGPTLEIFARNLAISGVLGTPGTPARYAPDGPAETFLRRMIRLAWLSKDERGGISLTPLSRALLRSELANDEASGDVLVLERESPLAYATLLGHVAEMGQVLIVDPYLRTPQLLDFVQSTNANRYLIGSGLAKREVVAMQTLVNATGWAIEPELRQAESGKLHDRFVVGDTAVYTLGLSINAVGRQNSTVLMPLPEEAADHVRDRMEEVWSNAAVLAPEQSRQPGDGDADV